MAETSDNDGGVIFNFISAMLIYVFVLYAWGETYLPTSNVKYGIVTDSVGYAIGLRNGDKIISVDNQNIENFMQITPDIVLNNRKTIQVDRNGEILNIAIPKDFIPKMLKGKGRSTTEYHSDHMLFQAFGKESPGKDSRSTGRG